MKILQIIANFFTVKPLPPTRRKLMCDDYNLILERINECETEMGLDCIKNILPIYRRDYEDVPTISMMANRLENLLKKRRDEYYRDHVHNSFNGV